MSPLAPPTDPLTIPFPGPVSGVAPPAAEPGRPTSRLLHQQRMVAVLRGVVEGLDLSAAELHLLDDASAELRVAADYGDGPTGEPRPLEGARADVAAMAGGAVVLEDAEMVAEWQVGRPCRAAVCVPVASDTTIHGTLWLYSKQPREFADRELQLIELTAGRLAVEIERRRLLDAPVVPRAAPAATRLPEPTIPDALGELEVGGWSAPTGATCAFHDWQTLADGRLLVVAGAVVDTPGGRQADTLLAAQAARVAARCHAEAIGAKPREAGDLLRRVSHSLWQATPGGEGLSMAAAVVDPEAFAGTYALAGGGVALAVRASHTNTEATEAPPVGWDPDERYGSHPFELSLRERLVLPILDPRGATPLAIDQLADAYRGLSAETHRRMTADRAAAALSDRPDAPLAAVAVRWR